MASLSPADAAVRPAVGKPLQEAQSLAAAGNYGAAMAKVSEAEAVGGQDRRRKPDHRADEGLHFLEVQFHAVGKGKFANDYRAAAGAR